MELREQQLLGQFIPLHYHGQMLADEQRLGAYRESILKLVPEGSHVVELGGGTGVLSFFAAQHARTVVCIERLAGTAAIARRLPHDNGARNVEVVEADALNWGPNEPVDVLICEMLHSGLRREKQVQVLSAFKAYHRARFRKDVPRIIPEATILAVQPIHQPYDFGGYHAPVPLFFNAGASSNTLELARPFAYAALDYVRDYSASLACDQVFTIEQAGTLNALRFVTKNVVGIFRSEQRSADWHMHYLSLPLSSPIAVQRVIVCASASPTKQVAQNVLGPTRPAETFVTSRWTYSSWRCDCCVAGLDEQSPPVRLAAASGVQPVEVPCELQQFVLALGMVRIMNEDAALPGAGLTARCDHLVCVGKVQVPLDESKWNGAAGQCMLQCRPFVVSRPVPQRVIVWIHDQRYEL